MVIRFFNRPARLNVDLLEGFLSNGGFGAGALGAVGKSNLQGTTAQVKLSTDIFSNPPSSKFYVWFLGYYVYLKLGDTVSTTVTIEVKRNGTVIPGLTSIVSNMNAESREAMNVFAVTSGFESGASTFSIHGQASRSATDLKYVAGFMLDKAEFSVYGDI